MPTAVKIKIHDIPELRNQLDNLYDSATQKEIAEWALEIAKYTLEQYAPSFAIDQIVMKEYKLNKSWQQGVLLSMNDLRLVGFAIHRLAKTQKSEIICTALRAMGQAVASAHMKEHGMVASDYTIKCCNIAYPNNEAIVVQERTWQINELKNICDEIN